MLDRFVYNAFARQGWVVPNQYWTPGAFAPMAITGRYFLHYSRDFLPPRKLGRENTRRMLKELMLDNLGPQLDRWVEFFTRGKHDATYEFWNDMDKGIHEMLREYPV